MSSIWSSVICLSPRGEAFSAQSMSELELRPRLWPSMGVFYLSSSASKFFLESRGLSATPFPWVAFLDGGVFLLRSVSSW